MNILHITNWYPNIFNTVEGVFIKEHIDSLKPYVHQRIVHIGLAQGDFKIVRESINEIEESYIIRSHNKIWLFNELLISFMLLLAVIRKKAWKYDIINFHIAYPLLIHFKLFRLIMKTPIIINEHWSIYGKNFNLIDSEKSDNKLRNVKKIFFNDYKILTVSKSLADQIIHFSGNKKLNYGVLPNVVNEAFFEYESDDRNTYELFSLAVWRKGKRPMILLKAINEVIREYPEVRLTIGGFGYKMPEMKEYVKANNLQDNVIFTGEISKKEIAYYMHKSGAFLHASDYETFSVVCAEAISCGCVPIISNIDSIKEYINEDRGIIVSSNRVEAWIEKIKFYIKNENLFDRKSLKKFAYNNFSRQKVGEKYYSYLLSCYDKKNH